MSKKSYRVREGVEWVNGARVPDARTVDLTDAEAKFDLDHGRIELQGTRSTRPKGASQAVGTDA